jgi:two-component system, NtrC family, sensor kinase
VTGSAKPTANAPPPAAQAEASVSAVEPTVSSPGPEAESLAASASDESTAPGAVTWSDLDGALGAIESLLEGSTDVIFFLDANGNLLDYNDAFVRRLTDVLGHCPARGTSLGHLWPEHHDAWAEPIARAFAGEASQFDFPFPHPRGVAEEFAVSLRPVLVGGVVRAVTVFSRNITADRRNARAIAEMDRLAAVGTVAAGVAHEIANPLTFVLSNLDAALTQLGRTPLLEQDPLPRIRTLLTDAKYGAHRIHELVKDLRSFSQPDEPQFRPVALDLVVERALTMAAGEIRGRARIEKHHEADLPRVMGSEGRLSQVALNLLVNAAQALPESDEEHVITSVLRTEGRDVVFEVFDTGIGVSRDALEHAFEPFFTTKAKGAGTGLGLSISKQIIIAHQGELTLQNRATGGAVARVRLPQVGSHATSAPPGSSGSRPSIPPPTSSHRG